MQHSNLHLWMTSPGAKSMAKMIESCLPFGGIVTSFDDDALSVLRSLVPEDDEYEVITLGDLVAKVRMACGLPRELMVSGAQSLSIATVVCRRLAADSPYGELRMFPGFHRAVQGVLDEFSHAVLALGELESIAGELEEPYRSRLASLAEIARQCELIRKQIGRKNLYELASDFLSLTPERVLQQPILILVGDLPAESHLRIVEWLGARNCTVHLVTESGELLFGSQSAVRDRLPEAQVHPAPEFEHWPQTLFDSGSIQRSGLQNLELFSTSDPMAECEWVLRRARDAQEELNIAEHQIAIYVTRPERYVPILRSIAKRMGFVISARIPIELKGNGFVSFVIRLLESLSSSRIREFVALTTSSYMGLGDFEQALLGQVSKDWHAQHGASWEKLDQWIADQDENFAAIKEVLKWRARAFEEARNLSGWHHLLSELLRAEPIADAAMVRDGGKATEDQHAMTAMLRILASASLVHDSQHPELVDLSAFAVEARGLWERDYMAPPGNEFGIRVVRRGMELPPCSALFCVGMTEDEVPGRRRENPVLGDEFRVEVNARIRGAGQLASSFDEIGVKRDEFVRICSAPTKWLVFSYSRRDDRATRIRSIFLHRLKQVLGAEFVEKEIAAKQLCPPVEQCRIPADLSLREALDGPRTGFPAAQLESAAARDVVAIKNGMTVPISLFSDAIKCPFRAVSRHILGLHTQYRHNTPYVWDRLPQLAELGKATDQGDARTRLETALKQLKDEVASNLSDSDLELFEQGALQKFDGWIQREFAMRQHLGINPDDVHYHVDLGDAPFFNRLRTQGVEIRLEGGVKSWRRIGDLVAIERFDSSDQKWEALAERPTSSTNPYGRLTELLSMIYLCRNQNVGYLIDSTKGERRLWTTEVTSPVIGKVKGKSVFKVSALPFETREELVQDVKKRLLDVVPELLSGKMRVMPSQNACQRCDYNGFCRHAYSSSSAPPAVTRQPQGEGEDES